MPKRKLTSLPQALAEHFSLPEDVVSGAILVMMVGNCGLRIENHRGIMQFTDCCLLLKGKHKNLRITGKRLIIRQFTAEILEISGMIESVSFEMGGRK